MDMAKFVSLLESDTLYLTRLKDLRDGDPYEGRFTDFQFRSLLELERQPLEVRIAAFGPPGGHGNRMTEQQITEYFRSVRAAMTEIENAGRAIYVNCWHVNDLESDAMWRLYSLQGQGIAIQTTYERLERSFHMVTRDIHIGLVSYNDYDSHVIDFGNIFNVALSKRLSFEHGRALRVVALHPSGLNASLPQEPGLAVPVDLEVLIERVLVSPKSPIWVMELIKAIVRRYGLANKPVAQSLLYTHQI